MAPPDTSLAQQTFGDIYDDGLFDYQRELDVPPGAVVSWRGSELADRRVETQAILAEHGLVMLAAPCERDEFFAWCASLGRVFNEFYLRHHPGTPSWSTNSFQTVCYHNDDPRAGLIGMWGEREGGAEEEPMLFVDLRAALAELTTAERDELTRLECFVNRKAIGMHHLAGRRDDGRHYALLAPALSDLENTTPAQRQLLGKLFRAAHTMNPLALRLQRGRAVLVDNLRMAHGRRRFKARETQETSRCIYRVWIDDLPYDSLAPYHLSRPGLEPDAPLQPMYRDEVERAWRAEYEARASRGAATR